MAVWRPAKVSIRSVRCQSTLPEMASRCCWLTAAWKLLSFSNVAAGVCGCALILASMPCWTSVKAWRLAVTFWFRAALSFWAAAAVCLAASVARPWKSHWSLAQVVSSFLSPGAAV